MKLTFSALLIWMTLSSPQLEECKHVQEIEFNTLSRGGLFEQIVITKDNLSYHKEERRSNKEKQIYSRELKKAEWKQLIQQIEHINLPDIPKLKSPTMKRAYDGAQHSEIIINTIDNK